MYYKVTNVFFLKKKKLNKIIVCCNLKLIQLDTKFELGLNKDLCCHIYTF